MRSVSTKLDRLNAQLIPNNADLWRAAFLAGERMTQEEVNALIASARHYATPEQEAQLDAWQERNAGAMLAIFDARFPRWREDTEENE